MGQTLSQYPTIDKSETNLGFTQHNNGNKSLVNTLGAIEDASERDLKNDQNQAYLLLGSKEREYGKGYVEQEPSWKDEIIYELTHKSKINEHDDLLFERCRDICD